MLETLKLTLPAWTVVWSMWTELPLPTTTAARTSMLTRCASGCRSSLARMSGPREARMPAPARRSKRRRRPGTGAAAARSGSRPGRSPGARCDGGGPGGLDKPRRRHAAARYHAIKDDDRSQRGQAGRRPGDLLRVVGTPASAPGWRGKTRSPERAARCATSSTIRSPWAAAPGVTASSRSTSSRSPGGRAGGAASASSPASPPDGSSYRSCARQVSQYPMWRRTRRLSITVGLPVPADQHPVKIRAVLAPPARHQQRPEDRPQPDTGPRDHRMGTPRRHPQHVSEVKAG